MVIQRHGSSDLMLAMTGTLVINLFDDWIEDMMPKLKLYALRFQHNVTVMVPQILKSLNM